MHRRHCTKPLTRKDSGLRAPLFVFPLTWWMTGPGFCWLPDFTFNTLTEVQPPGMFTIVGEFVQVSTPTYLPRSRHRACQSPLRPKKSTWCGLLRLPLLSPRISFAWVLISLNGIREPRYLPVIQESKAEGS